MKKLLVGIALGMTLSLATSYARPIKVVKRGKVNMAAVHKDIVLGRGDSIAVIWTGKNGGRHTYIVPLTRKGASIVLDINITER